MRRLKDGQEALTLNLIFTNKKQMLQNYLVSSASFWKNYQVGQVSGLPISLKYNYANQAHTLFLDKVHKQVRTKVTVRQKKENKIPYGHHGHYLLMKARFARSCDTKGKATATGLCQIVTTYYTLLWRWSAHSKEESNGSTCWDTPSQVDTISSEILCVVSGFFLVTFWPKLSREMQITHGKSKSFTAKANKLEIFSDIITQRSIGNLGWSQFIFVYSQGIHDMIRNSTVWRSWLRFRFVANNVQYNNNRDQKKPEETTRSQFSSVFSQDWLHIIRHCGIAKVETSTANLDLKGGIYSGAAARGLYRRNTQSRTELKWMLLRWYHSKETRSCSWLNFIVFSES